LRKFPRNFHAIQYNSNIMKASCILKNRAEYFGSYE
jgi:hypothetical protein